MIELKIHEVKRIGKKLQAIGTIINMPFNLYESTDAVENAIESFAFMDPLSAEVVVEQSNRALCPKGCNVRMDKVKDVFVNGIKVDHSFIKNVLVKEGETHITIKNELINLIDAKIEIHFK